jgi:hypothetical protein
MSKMSEPIAAVNTLVSGEITSDKAASKDISRVEVSSTSDESSNDTARLIVVPLSFKLASILLVSAIGFGSSWSSGITGAMKTTLKKVCQTAPDGRMMMEVI